MRNFCLSIVFLIGISTIYFSCAKEENQETEPPVIDRSTLRVNMNDTLLYRSADGKIQRLRINDSLNINREIDTVVIGKWIYVSVRLRDNEGLSTFKVQGELSYDKVNVQDPQKGDSILKFVKIGQPIFGETDVYAYRNRIVQIQDTIKRYDKTGRVDTLVLDNTKDHELKIACIDIAGNGDSLHIPFRLVSRKKVYDDRIKP